MSNSRITNFLASSGIYSELEISIQDRQELKEIVKGDEKHTFDAYCPQCRQDSVFHFEFEQKADYSLKGMCTEGTSTHNVFESDSEEEKYSKFISENSLTILTAHCSRASHMFWIFIKLEKDRISKIGQYPDVALVQSPQVNRFRNLLGTYFIELKTALKLHSYNVGVGSFVYLRRIFERIIFDKFNEHNDELSVSEDDFAKYRMEGKINALRNYLPEFIVENKGIYDILSKGIHELDEDECSQHFDVIEESIEMILDEIIEQKAKEAKKKGLTAAVAKIKGTL